MYTTKQKNGLISETLAITQLVKRDIPFSIPYGSFDEYDIIADTSKGLKRIQVKTCYFDNNAKRYVVSLATSHRRGNETITNKKYSIDSFDYLIAVCIILEIYYIIPINVIEGKRAITLYPEGIPETTIRSNKNAGYNYEEYKENWKILM